MTATVPETVPQSAPAPDGQQPEVRLDPVSRAIEALRAGCPVLVVDDADRENEGDVVLAAVNATPQWVGWTVRHTSGVLCAPMPAEVADRLALPPMVVDNQDPRGTAYTVSVDARVGVSTGISAGDRAHTLRVLADESTQASDLVRPGHVFPLRAKPGGVLERPGHTEAAVDLCRLAGLPPVAVIAEVVEDSGEVMRLPQLRELADRSRLPLISIADLAQAVPRVRRVTTTLLPTRYGTFRAHGYQDLITGDEHVCLVAGRPEARGALVRVHSECLTGDAFGSQRCDCGPQLDAALREVAADGGVIVYVGGHEGRGIGLLAKLSAYELQDAGMDTVAANTAQGLPADAREYGAAAAILADLGLNEVRLLTNNPGKVTGLAARGVSVLERVPLEVGITEFNQGYLAAKRDLMGHLLRLPAAVPDTLGGSVPDTLGAVAPQAIGGTE